MATRVVTTTDEVVTVQAAGVVGPKGPKGDKGEAGVSGGTGEASFAVESDRWEFVHNLGYAPAVMLFDRSGAQIGGRIVLNDSERTVAEFFLPVAGRMTVS